MIITFLNVLFSKWFSEFVFEEHPFAMEIQEEIFGLKQLAYIQQIASIFLAGPDVTEPIKRLWNIKRPRLLFLRLVKLSRSECCHVFSPLLSNMADCVVYLETAENIPSCFKGSLAFFISVYQPTARAMD